MDLSLKHDAALCMREHCEICEGMTEKSLKHNHPPSTSCWSDCPANKSPKDDIGYSALEIHDESLASEELLVSQKKLSERLGPPSGWDDCLTELMTKDTLETDGALCARCETVHKLPRFGEDNLCRSADTTPNHFDPYKALDMMIQILVDCMEHERPRGGKPRASLGGYLILDGDYATLSNQVYALRAYITGMEK